MSTLCKALRAIKTLERSHFQMNSLDVALDVSKRKETIGTGS